MEEIISKILKKEPNFEFIDREHQVLQVLLSPQQKIITRPSNVIYFSNNIRPYSQNPPSNYLTNFLTILGKKTNYYEELSYELLNQSEGLGYVGLSQKPGKILAINPIIFNFLIMREKNVLAYSKSIEIIWKIKPNFKNLHNVHWCKIRNIALEKDGMLFLQAGSTIIEKELGLNESFLVREDCLLAFTNSVTFAENSIVNKFSVKGRNLIEIKGPGTVFIENQPFPQQNLIRDFKIVEIFVLMMVINAVWTFTELLSLVLLRNNIDI